MEISESNRDQVEEALRQASIITESLYQIISRFDEVTGVPNELDFSGVEYEINLVDDAIEDGYTALKSYDALESLR